MSGPHYNIPVFIPGLACPFYCVFCNQQSITGKCKAPDEIAVKHIIDTHLSTLTPGEGTIEVAFFGGSFTALDMEVQNRYLEMVKPYLEKGAVSGIRISTRPDFITHGILINLRSRGVVAIELGAQSLDDEVLEKSGRGHTVQQVETAAGLIYDHGFELGLQMMTGLPGDNEQKSLNTAQKIIELNAATTRIYPTLVIRNTPLEKLYARGAYFPQSLEEAVNLCAKLYELFQANKVKVLRTGLHPSEGMLNGESLVAGPFHPAFGELVMSKIWQNRLISKTRDISHYPLTIYVHPSDLNAAIGHKASNRKILEKEFGKIYFKSDITIKKGALYVDHAR